MREQSLAAAAAALLLLAGGAMAQKDEKPLKAKEQAQAFERTLDGMIGQPLNDVREVVEGWKFEALAAWEAVNPTAKEVAGHDRSKIKFSKKDYAEIFGPGGAFKVVVYTKLFKTETTTLGTVDSFGMAAGKDSTLSVDKFTVIRVVFKDNALLVAKVWPTMDQGGISGGMHYRR